MFSAPSSIARIAASNDPPEQEVLDAIQAVLKGPKQEYDALSVELSQVQATLQDLQAKQKRLQAQMCPLRVIISPIRHLPDDILQEIFLACLPDDHYPTLDPLQAPLLLTHISRPWRFVAINTRRLWTAIHIPLPVLNIPSQSIHTIHAEVERCKLKTKFGRISSIFLEMVEEWVDRIGGCSLSFSVCQQDNQSVEEDFCLQALLQILLRGSKGWEHVDIAAPLRSVGCVVDARPEDFPSLKSLAICTTSRHPLSSQNVGFPNIFGAGQAVEEPLPSWSLSRIFEAPRLDSVSLCRVDEPLQSMPIDWTKLTSLVAEMQGGPGNFGYLHQGLVIDVPVLAGVLRQCGMLRNARIALTPGASEPPGDHEALSHPIHLPSLVSLAFFEDRSSSASLFKILEAPQLIKLEFHTLRKATNGLAAHGPSFSLLPFLRRHGSKLEELMVDTRFISPLERVKVWETSTTLRCLRLTPSTFQSVTYPGDEQNLIPFTNFDLQQLLVPFTPRTSGPRSGPEIVVMPNLQSFECSTLSTLTDRGVLEFLRGRKVCGLHHVRMNYEKDWDLPVENFVDEVEVLREGMDVVLEKKARPSFLQPRQGLKIRCNATL
ncbi:hypothetical protein NMY22_g12447 [Coprinellus aureogranulatus]|nr:hypothetical protein NMY22_g12447 [Coprinellus aureogranulatus]